MAIGYPTGRTVSYLRNTAGEIVAVTTALPGEPAHTVADGIAWEAFGPVQRLTHGNGVTALRHYDADGHLTQWDVSGLLNRTYVRDAAGRITEIYDADPSRSETYGYDDADRLSGAAGPYGARAWTYDAVGNRLSQDKDGQWSGYTYGGMSNRLYQVAGHEASSLDYDAAGNTLAKGAFAFTYNAANRVRSVMVSGATGPETVTFAYTALGERVLKSGPSGTTHFHYDLAGHLIAESDAAGTVIREYLWLGDTPIVLVATRNAGSERELFHVHADHLDTALLLTDSAQQVVWRYARDPFGELVAGAHTVRWPLRFPGQYEDAETGLFYNYFRDYDATTGRYIQSDPIGLGGGVNTYAYVGGNPVGWADRFGLTREDIDRLTELVRQTQPDLNVPSRVGTMPMTDDGLGLTNPITRSIRVNNDFLEPLDETRMRELLDTLIHESIHRTRSRLDMIIRPFNHRDIYDDAHRRTREIESRMCY